MTDKDDDFHRFDLELSDREIFFIGKIVALWGALEYEIFAQTFLTFSAAGDELPKEMNNLSFPKVLSLWKTRVVDVAGGTKAEVLQQQYDGIDSLQDYRNALMHGMWDWSMAEPAKISVVRIRKKEIVTTHFTADDLKDFFDRLTIINFKIRFPGGVEDLAREQVRQGGYMSRRFVSVLRGDPVASDLFPDITIPKRDAESEPPSQKG